MPFGRRRASRNFRLHKAGWLHSPNINHRTGPARLAGVGVGGGGRDLARGLNQTRRPGTPTAPCCLDRSTCGRTCSQEEDEIVATATAARGQQ